MHISQFPLTIDCGRRRIGVQILINSVTDHFQLESGWLPKEDVGYGRDTGGEDVEYDHVLNCRVN